MKKILVVLVVLVSLTSVFAQLSNMKFNKMKSNIELLSWEQRSDIEKLLEKREMKFSGFDEWPILKALTKLHKLTDLGVTQLILTTYERHIEVQIVLANGKIFKEKAHIDWLNIYTADAMKLVTIIEGKMLKIFKEKIKK